MKDAMISVLSKQTVRPSPRKNEGDGEPKRIHLTPWDLRLLPGHYGQRGLLFHKPADLVIPNLFPAFSQALDLFYPLAGRLVTTTHDDDGSISVSLDCTDEGAEFIHASAPHVRVSDVLAPDYRIPTVVHSLFPLNGTRNAAGRSLPLLAAQVTELADGAFVACSLNNCVGDGSFFFHFLSTWSRMCRDVIVEKPSPAFDRWFPDTCPPPLRLPFKYHQQLIKISPPAEIDSCARLDQCAFDFPARNVCRLKAKANGEAGSNRISSLQAVTAHAWRAITRARSLRPEQETACFLVAGYRARLSPPLPESYLGSAVLAVPTEARAGEMEDAGLGWTASLLNRTVSGLGSQDEVREWFESWCEDPSSWYCLGDEFGPANVVVTGSPRFGVYEVDFGWGRPVAVQSGPGTLVEGHLTVYAGAEEGGMTLEVCLKVEEMKALLEDGEFMEAVASA